MTSIRTLLRTQDSLCPDVSRPYNFEHGPLEQLQLWILAWCPPGPFDVTTN
jgi:hypothetical protein